MPAKIQIGSSVQAVFMLENLQKRRIQKSLTCHVQSYNHLQFNILEEVGVSCK